MGFWAALAAAGAKGGGDALSAGIDYWTGFNERRHAASLDWQAYQNQAALDAAYYQNLYAPLQYDYQKKYFDYTSAKQYEQSISYIGDSLRAQKQALLNNGYNPILAVNGGLAAPAGQHFGTAASAGSPHSAKGVNVSASSRRWLSGIDFLSMLKAAKDVDYVQKQIDVADATKEKIAAETRHEDAKTAEQIKSTAEPGAAGDTWRTLKKAVENIGERILFEFNQAKDVWQRYHGEHPFVGPKRSEERWPGEYNPDNGTFYNPHWRKKKSIYHTVE